MDFTESYLDTSSSVALAARAGNVEALERLIRQGKSLNQQDNRGWRPIHEAAYWGNSQCLRILLSQRAIEVDARTFEGETALWLAANNGSTECAAVLLEFKANVNMSNNESISPFHCVASKGFQEVAQLLIDHGANVSSKDFGLSTPLHEAAISGFLPLVEILLDNHADLRVQDCHGRTPLFCAAQSHVHSCQIVKLLLEKSPPSIINQRACDGATSVMLASQTGCLDCVQLLVNSGGDSNLKAHDGIMAVHISLTGDHEKILKYLLEITDHSSIEQSCAAGLHQHHHGDWNQSGSESVNIFSLAISYDRLHLIETLLDGGLIADHFPQMWELSETVGMATEWMLRYNLSTPLSFTLLQKPFNRLAAEAVEALVRFGSNVSAVGDKFIPPLVALTLAPGWSSSDEEERSLLSSTLELLIEKGAPVYYSSSCGLTDVFYAALCFSPKMCLALMRMGFLITEQVVEPFVKFASSPAENERWNSVHIQSSSLLSAAGLLKQNDRLAVRPLLELSRSEIHSKLRHRNFQASLRTLDLSLPSVLMEYLCFSDVTL